MKKTSLTALLLGCLFLHGQSQELFVFTEPASNMAKGNLGLRLMASSMKEAVGSEYNNHLMPELMYGVNNKLMVHLAAFISNRNTSFVTEGGSLYAKYKFLNNDDVQSHFRMAAFGRYSWNNADIHQQEINLIGHNTGFELGMNATQLLHKWAFSAGISYQQAANNGSKYEFPSSESNKAMYYTLSLGKLMLPKAYTGYEQTNLNLMVELLGQSLLSNGKSYLDIAPSVQLIIHSKMRIDLAYRKELYSNMIRTAPNGLVLKLEYNFFNVY
jgi:hypothetical protein